MKEIVVATKNKGKVAEMAAALSHLPVLVRPVSDFDPIDEPEETGTTFLENAVLKARYYANKTGRACLADDSGLEVDALNGAPGVYSARYSGENATDASNNAKLLGELRQLGQCPRTARFRSVLAFCDGSELVTVNGTCEGKIIDEPRGSGGFGYDPLFYMDDYSKTLAEMTVEEKNQVSHRGKALKLMVAELGRRMA